MTKNPGFTPGLLPYISCLYVYSLEEVRRELKNRPTENRDVLVVCFGKELAAGSWLTEYNKLRKTGVPNKIQVIELKTDPKYKNFFTHKPPKVRAEAKFKDDQVVVAIRDFVSFSVIGRLKQQGGPFAPEPVDWKSMVESVLIDTDYDGKVFNVVVSDVPMNRKEIFVGSYKIPVKTKKKKFVVAVKIVDVLGEEVFKTFDITRTAK